MGKTRTINSSDVGNQIGKLIDETLQGHLTIIQRYGRAVAVIVPVSVHEEYLAMKAEHEADEANEAVDDRLDKA